MQKLSGYLKVNLKFIIERRLSSRHTHNAKIDSDELDKFTKLSSKWYKSMCTHKHYSI